MKKNEQLLRTLGEIYPAYIKEAAPGNVPQKQHGQAIYIRKRSLIALIAAMLAFSVMMFSLGFSASAMTYDPSEQQSNYQMGTLLTDVPTMLLPQDYQALFSNLEKNLLGVPDGGHILTRFKAYYALQSLSLQHSPKAREGLLRAYPIVQLTDVYTMDVEMYMEELETLIYWMMYYGELTQEELIRMHERLCAAVEESDLDREEKLAVHQSLPAAPTLDPSAAVVMWEVGKKIPTQDFSYVILPKLLTVEDYQALEAQVLQSVGARSRDTAPAEIRRMLASYQRYPLADEPQDETQAFISEYLAPVLEKMDVYVMDISMTLGERSLLCYQMNRYVPGWQKKAEDYDQNLRDALRERCQDEEDYRSRQKQFYNMSVEYERLLRQQGLS